MRKLLSLGLAVGVAAGLAMVPFGAQASQTTCALSASGSNVALVASNTQPNRQYELDVTSPSGSVETVYINSYRGGTSVEWDYFSQTGPGTYSGQVSINDKTLSGNFTSVATCSLSI